MNLKVGDKAPNFKLKNQNNKEIELKDYLGRNVLVYFYPADFTPHCTSQACNLRNNFDKLTGQDIVILGISTDSPEKHAEFIREYELPFDLLSDKDGSVSKLYDSLSEPKILGFTLTKISKRNSFLINKEGVLVNIMENVEPQTHAYEIIRFCEK
jgi:peroxiredoxin Q/BCP